MNGNEGGVEEGGGSELVFQLHPIAGLAGINECGCSVYCDGETMFIDAEGLGEKGEGGHKCRVFAWHHQTIPTPNNTAATSFSPSLPRSLL